MAFAFQYNNDADLADFRENIRYTNCLEVTAQQAQLSAGRQNGR